MIDWDFIGSLEGRSLIGYVPDSEGSRSGVTIASGIDLGSWKLEMLSSLSPRLAALFLPYVGLRGSTAVNLLNSITPRLTITSADAAELDQLVRAKDIDYLTAAYDRASFVEFEEIPDRAQTVIMSVAFQYGTLEIDCPKFWNSVIVQEWLSAHYILSHFGDDYPTRRRTEAAYLYPLLSTIKVIA